MKFLNNNLFTGDITVNGTTTLSTATGITRTTSDSSTHLATTAFVKAQDYATNTALGNYVPVSRTLTINGVTLDLSANRSWTIATSDYTSTLKHTVKAGVAITKGQAVYVTSADGTNMIVGLASNATEATSSKTMGLVDTTVAVNGFTSVITEGLLAGLNTSAAETAGEPVWLGVNGNLIFGLANKPYAPAHLVFIGIVTRVNVNNGEIFVKVQNGFELKEIHDVDLITTAPINGHLLGYNGTLWVNKTIAGWLGYTPANASGTTNYVSKFTGTTTLGNSQIFDNGTNVGIGTTSPTFPLSVQGIAQARGGVYITQTSPTNTLILNADDTALHKIYTNASVDLSLGTNSSTSQLYLKSGGNVGIGTDSPSNKLHIRQTGIVDNTATTLLLIDGQFQDSSVEEADIVSIGFRIENSTGGSQTSQAISFAYNNILSLMKDGGNVGIGTTSPSYKLDVNGALRATGTLYSDNGALAGALNLGQVVSIGSSFGSFANLVFTMHNGGGFSDIMKLQGNGNVGIGTTSPTARLHVEGNATPGNYAAYIHNSSGGGNVLKLYNADWDISDYLLYATNGGTAASGFAFVVDGNGKVGIGTTTPNSQLQVGSSNFAITGRTSAVYGAASETIFTVGVSGVDYPQLLNFGVNQAGLYSTISARQFTVATENKLILQPNGGNVGIGTTSPANKLQVANGDMSITSGYSFILADTDTNWRLGRNIISPVESVYLNSNTFEFVAANASDQGWQFINDDGYPVLEIGAATGSRNVWVNAGNLLVPTGSVGIGTSSPGTKLDVNGVITATGGTSTQWNTAYGWGNHAGLYLGVNSKASDSELLDGIDSSRFVYGNSGTRRGTNLISNWNQNDYPDVAFLSAENGGTNAPSSDYSYGMQYSFHRSGAPYRTQFVTSLYSDLDIWVRNSRDSDVWTSWKRLWHSNDFTSTNISNWNTAYGWGNHASQSYATQTYVNTAIANLVDSAPSTLDTLNELAAALGDDSNFATTIATSIGTKQNQLNGTGFVKVSGTTVSYDNSTYYLASNPSGFISSYTETDTLASVTGRGASTSTNSVFTGGLQARKNQTDNNYSTAALWTESYGNTTTGIAFHISGNVGKFLEMRTNGILYWDNAQVWTAGTLTNLNQLTNGPGYITGYTETDTLNSVTGRGNTTSNSVRFGSNVDLSPTNSAFRFYDGSTFRGGLGLDDWAHSGSAANITAYVNGDNNFFISTSGVKRAQFNSSAAIFRTYSTDTAYNIRLTGGDQINAYYNDAVATLYLQYHNGNGGTLNVGNGKLTVNTAGSVVASGDMRAPIFYDSNDTNYYLDLSAATSSYAAGVFRQNDGKFVRDSHYRTFSGFSNYYPSENAGWYRVAEITLTTNCAGAVLYGTLYDYRYDGADAYQVSIVARAECDFTSNNESHYINVGCTILGSTNHVDYKSKIRVVLSASSASSRTYEVQFYETAWNQDTWQLETTGWTIYTTPQAPRAAVGTPKVYYVSNQNADYQRANTATYSPVYYDSDDTTYYADFNSTSGSAIKIRGGILTGPNPSWSQFLQLGGDGNNSSHATVAVTNGNLHIDAKNGSATYINHYYGNKIHLGSGGAGGGTYTHSNFSLAGNLNLGGGDGDASHRLQVIGNALVQGTQGFNAAGETASLYIGDTASEIRAVYDGGLDFYQNSVHRVRIESGTGNFGIGTSDPNYKLHVVGNAYINETLFVNQQTTIEDNLLVTQGIGQNNLIGRPAVMWSASGTSTGAVMIKFPGTTGNYGMVHAVVDIYEYNGNTVSTIIIGGHNWNGAWYFYGANLIGQTDKQVRLAVVDGAYAIVIGDNSSSWSYGQVVLRKIQNGGYYQNVMNVYDGYIASQTTSLSASWISGDLRRLVVSGVITANGGNSGEWNTAFGWGNHAGLYQPLENQRLSTTNSPTFVDIYANEWFRNNNINEGLYNQATATHFYSNGATSWAITGSGGNVQLEFRSNHQSTIRGFVYADTANQIGFLNDGGSWALRMNSTRNAEIFGSDLTIGAGGANSTNIIMGDNDEGARIIHCNSNRIGFLTQAGAWGAYCDDAGNWTAANFSGSSSGTNTGDQTNISGNAATATTAPSGINRGDQIHGSAGVTPATSFASMPSGMSGFTDNWSGGDLPSGMSHVHGIACRHFNNTSNSWGWHMVGQYDQPGDLRVRWVNAGTWTAYYQLLSSSNYNSYSPTLTGTGASGTWGISITGNANTATSATSASTAGYSDEAKWISYPDGPRDLSDRLPNWNNRSVAWDFVGAGTANGSGNYGGVMTFSPWDGTSASTGDSSYQLAFANATGVNASGQPKLSIRNGINSTWNAWYTLVHSGNVGDQSVSFATTAGALSSMNISQFTNNSGYITGYTETDTLGTVTNRGNSTSQNLVFSNGRKGLVGVYDAAQTQAIFAMGAAYTLTDGGASATIGNLYGLAWSYNPGYGGAGNNPQSKAGLEHQLLLMNNGVTLTALGAGIWTSGLITTTSYGTSSNWNTAYGWGNHASAGYITGNQTITLSGDVSGSGTTSIVVTVNNIDGWGFVNTGSNSPTDADSINSNGISYYNAGVTNFSGNATDGALYSQRYSDSWQHQIAGDYRSGMIAVRGKNNGTWTSWKTIIDSSTIGSQSVSYATSAGSASSATSATQVVTIQDNPPTGVNGKLWWESDTGKLKVYYGTSSAWVDATPVPDMSLYYAKAGGPISGDVTIQQTLTVVGNTLIQGTLTETSDISLKENILPLESSLDKVMKLNGVSFNKKATPNVKEIGFIAQEVEAVIPDLVTETNEGIKTVSYSRVTAVLVETIKEQQAQINTQQSQIEELKNMVNMLAEKLNSL